MMTNTLLHADKTRLLLERLTLEWFWRDIPTLQEDYEDEKNDD